MAERLKAPDSKSDKYEECFVGSNPTPSASFPFFLVFGFGCAVPRSRGTAFFAARGEAAAGA